jgi:carboxylesterase type B
MRAAEPAEPPAGQRDRRPARFTEDERGLSVSERLDTGEPRQRTPARHVWIFGGAYSEGGGNTPHNDGENLAKKGVILVNFNYRLGIFGFYAHPELTKESPHNASGNQALARLHRRAAMGEGEYRQLRGRPQ